MTASSRVAAVLALTALVVSGGTVGASPTFGANPQVVVGANVMVGVGAAELFTTREEREFAKTQPESKATLIIASGR